ILGSAGASPSRNAGIRMASKTGSHAGRAPNKQAVKSRCQEMRKSGRTSAVARTIVPPGNTPPCWFAVSSSPAATKFNIGPAHRETLAIFADCAACTLYLLLGGCAGLGNGRGSLPARARLVAVLAAAQA